MKAKIVMVEKRNGTYKVKIRGNSRTVAYMLYTALVDVLRDTLQEGVTPEQAADTMRDSILESMKRSKRK